MRTRRIQRNTTPTPAVQQGKSERFASSISLGKLGDAYEQEADRVADQVVSNTTGPVVAPIATTPLIQRMEAEEEEETLQTKSKSIQRMEADDEEEPVQMKAARTSSPTASTAAAASAVTSGGRPLSRAERAYFEPRFGHDFSSVRIHTGATAQEAAQSINARAYTLRNNIAFAPGQHNPGSTEGRRLLAHELTHTLQQGRSNSVKQISKATFPGKERGLPSRSNPFGTPTRSNSQGFSSSGSQSLLGGQAMIPNSPHLKLLQATRKMCRGPQTAAILARIDADNVEIRFFKGAFDKKPQADGTVKDRDLSDRLRGNMHKSPTTGKGIIRINENLSAHEMVETLFHETQHWIHRQDPAGHRGLESEIQARMATEQLAIDRGWPETRRNYRTKDGRVNEKHIRKKMKASKHYDPKLRAFNRRYTGETVLPGPWACPPVGDFPTPTRGKNIAIA